MLLADVEISHGLDEKLEYADARKNDVPDIEPNLTAVFNDHRSLHFVN